MLLSRSSRLVASRLALARTKATVASLTAEDLDGKRVFLRADLNVPRDKKTGKITDDTRIRESLQTINYLRERGAKVILASHMGRPKTGVDEALRLDRVAESLRGFGVDVTKTSDCVGPEVESAVAKMFVRLGRGGAWRRAAWPALAC